MGAISLMHPVSGAAAQSLAGFSNAIAAHASGAVFFAPDPNPFAPGVVISSTGIFNGLVLAGVFAAATDSAIPGVPTVCAGAVSSPSGIPFTTTGNLLFGYANIVSGGFSGAGVGCSVNFESGITGGSFLRVGPVLLAQVQLRLNISAPTGNGSSSNLIGELVGELVPGMAPCAPADLDCNAFEGRIVGYS